jgi:hypothetical protein
MNCVKTTNRLIQLNIIYKLNIKITKYYNKECKTKQYIKCQKYKYFIYIYKNK